MFACDHTSVDDDDDDDDEQESSADETAHILRSPQTPPNMNRRRLPPLIEEVLDSYGQLEDDVCHVTRDGTLNEDEEEEAGVEELRLRMVELLMELEETRNDSCRQEENFLEMKSMLEDERMAKAHQAETFTRQLDALKVQLVRVREELAAAEREKRSRLEDAETALRRAEEAALALQEAGEEAAAESENDIACLQEELCRLGVQIQRSRDRAGRVLGPRTESGAVVCCHGDLGADGAHAEDEFASLSRQRLQLGDANRQLSGRVREEEQKQPAHVTEEGPRPSSADLPEAARLRLRLRQVEDAEPEARAERERVARSLGSLRRLHDDSRRRCAALEEELRCRKAELKAELGRVPVEGTQSGPSPPETPYVSAPVLGVIAIMGLMWCWWEELAS
ncbi:uncharacterized protein LOC144068820 isoform X2 [Stigmatopora argus]